MAPERIPDTSTCVSMAGVSMAFTPAGRPLSLIPGGRGEARLARGELVRPDGHLLAVLPLEQDHLVGDLEAVRVDLVVAEHRAHLELEELLADLLALQRPRALHGLRVDDAARVARRGVIDGLVTELLLVARHEFLLARIG